MESLKVQVPGVCPGNRGGDVEVSISSAHNLGISLAHAPGMLFLLIFGEVIFQFIKIY